MRPAKAIIDLAALQHNYLVAKTLSGTQALAVIKADAYGHGAEVCAQSLDPVVDGYAVASLEEALILRQLGILKPILLLEGFFSMEELPILAEQQLWCVLHSQWQVIALSQAKLSQPIGVWLKMDTGMHRLGFAPNEFLMWWQKLKQMPQVKNITAMTHFAQADELTSKRSLDQLSLYQEHSLNLQHSNQIMETSFSNSAAILASEALFGRSLPQSWVRPGLMLYGVTPFAQESTPIVPVMTMRSQIIAEHQLNVGDALGYGGTFIASRPTRVGTVAMGYADGYPRQLNASASVYIEGALAKIIGRVSMDMLTIDLTDLPMHGIHTPVELWGKNHDINQVASTANTIAYQLLCNVKRVQRSYLKIGG